MNVKRTQGARRAVEQVSPLSVWATRLAPCVFFACAGSNAPDLVHDTLDAAVVVADPAYDATVRACLGAEKAALVTASDESAWVRARDEIRHVCDAAVLAWEQAVESQTAARAAIDSCHESPDAQCVSDAIGTVQSFQRAVIQARTAWEVVRPVLDRYLGDPQP